MKQCPSLFCACLASTFPKPSLRGLLPSLTVSFVLQVPGRGVGAGEEEPSGRGRGPPQVLRQGNPSPRPLWAGLASWCAARLDTAASPVRGVASSHAVPARGSEETIGALPWPRVRDAHIQGWGRWAVAQPRTMFPPSQCRSESSELATRPWRTGNVVRK